MNNNLLKNPKLHYFISLTVLIIILSCHLITDKIEKKVDEKINQSIEDSKKKVDSLLNKISLDSLNRQFDSLSNKNQQQNKNGKTKN